MAPVAPTPSRKNISALFLNLTRHQRCHLRVIMARDLVHSHVSPSGFAITNGHHKPVRKHNNIAYKCGLSYVVPRAHSIHGSSLSSLANRSVDSLPHTSTIDALYSESYMKDSMVSAQQAQCLVKSEHSSPLMSPSNLDQLNGDLPPLNLSSILGDYNFSQNLYGFSTIPDDEQALFSLGLSSASINWSRELVGRCDNAWQLTATSPVGLQSVAGLTIHNSVRSLAVFVKVTSDNFSVTAMRGLCPGSEPSIAHSWSSTLSPQT